jgi:hypothetical protein
MELLLTRKGIFYFWDKDDAGNHVQYAFTKKMLLNNLYIEFRESWFDEQAVEDNESSADTEHDNEALELEMEEVEFDLIQPSEIQEAESPETTVTVSAIINNQGMDYFIFVHPETPVSKMVLYRIIVDLVEVLDNCPYDQLHNYLVDASTSHMSAKQAKHLNPKLTITRDILNKIKMLKSILDQDKNNNQ